MCFLRKVCVPSPGQLPRAGAGASTASEHPGVDLCCAPEGTASQLSWTNPSSAATGTLVSCYKWKLWIDNKLLLGTGMVWSSERAESLLWGLSCNLDIAKTAPSPRGSPGSTGVCLSYCPQITIRSFSWKRKRHSVHIKTATMEEEIAFH